ncbi:12081_t:CDS:2 [Cetraspora pellucida]|uniref:12081_t:CDS:1 n=1 Tax=Cetraspora pellucida TaxID=1433469 RepID=A0ACA9K426_9GLOM|nr:12081_t:CDS:2 [Cetraspora pellucida]
MSPFNKIIIAIPIIMMIFSIIFVKNKKASLASFTFDVDGTIVNKSFKPDIKLEDVRKSLAEGRDDLKAEKLLFKQNGNLILHKYESNYTLNELSSEPTIHVKNLLKEIKVHVDDKQLTVLLDPNDKLKDIHTIFIEKIEKCFTNDGVNKNKKDFKFRWENRKLVSEPELDNCLKEILLNHNELYITILQEGNVNVYSSHSKIPNQPFRFSLHKGKNLDEIREELENDLIEQNYFFMCSECCFLDQKKAGIPKLGENKLILGEILSVENSNYILNIDCKRGHDVINLINKCGCGLIIKDGLVEQAEYNAFTFKKAPDHRILNGKYADYYKSFECKNEFQELCKRNFITFESATSILPWVSVFLGVSYSDSLEKLKEYNEAKKYSFASVKRAKITISKNCISLTKEFKKEIEKALEEENKNKKIENLKQIAEKYGYFYPSTVYFGGIIVQRTEDIKYIKSEDLNINPEIGLNGVKSNIGVSLQRKSNNNDEIVITEYSYTIKGGDISKFKFNDRSEWINSINDSEKWDIIEYYKINSIFSLLDGDLKKRVIEALGKRILKAEIETIQYEENKNKHVHDLSRQLKNIPDVQDCHILTTVLKTSKDRHVFSSYVSYDGRLDKPIIIINRVPSKKKPNDGENFIIKIGWMVIGYPTDTFDFELSNQVVVKSDIHTLNDQNIISEKISHQNNIGHMRKYALTACVLDNIGSTISPTSNMNTLNIHDSKLVVGSHLFYPQDLAQPNFLNYDFKGKVEWNNRSITKKSSVWHSKINPNNNKGHIDKSLIFVSRNHPDNKSLTSRSSVQDPETDQNESPIFINQLFDKNCPGNNFDGIINVNPTHFQLRILSNNEFTTKKSEIYYLRIPQEINLYP